MAPRRSHKKSRAGCGKCKKRRIKCDEVHPRCGNCAKHAIVCDFSLPADEDAISPQAISPQSSGSASIAMHGSHCDPFSLPPPPVPMPASAPAPPPTTVAAPAPPQFNVVDLALIHQWTIETANTISNRPDLQLLWRVKIPELAVHQPYLMHAILGVSALHLHTKGASPSTDYLATARAHHDRAVRGMATQLAHISQDNCHALVVASCLVVIYSFVATRLALDDPDPSPQPRIAAWMPLLRGVHSILKQAWTWVTDGPLSDLITQYKLAAAAPNAILPPATDAAIASLFRLCTDRSLPDPHRELDDTKVSTAYFSVISQLRQSYASMTPAYENLIAVIFIWPIIACDEYVELLVARRPRALVIFLHYCALFTLAEEFWWSRGNAELECGRIEELLGPEWGEWVRWPKERIVGARVREGGQGGVGVGENVERVNGAGGAGGAGGGGAGVGGGSGDRGETEEDMQRREGCTMGA
ncbi:hypothetical protein EDC01DRAFT_701768 [Geopyxis carbonaria]|nr:hypothetical protein EDC01DRAFT_701768 [Geopyxis carbonaria]